MSDAPLPVWPLELQWVRNELTRLYNTNPRYESAWFVWLSITFGIVFPATTEARYGIRPQYMLRYPVGPAPAEPSIFEDDDLDGPEPVDPDPDALIVEDNFDPGDTSIVSLGFSAQGRGQGVETALRIPDFVIDRARGNARRLVVLIEVKAKTRLNTEDFQRFARYYFRLGDIDQAGGAVQGAQLMLIAGGRAYVWDYGNWPARTLRTSDLAQMTPIAVDTREFLGKLREIRDSPQLQIV